MCQPSLALWPLPKSSKSLARCSELDANTCASSMRTLCGAMASMSEVSMSPPCTPKRCSWASNACSASPKGNWYQLLLNTVRPQWPRSSRATTSIKATLPPCALKSKSFLRPVRATDSPRLHHCSMTEAGEKLKVPSYALCSLLKPTVWVGNNNTGSDGCKCDIAAASMALTKSVSTDKGRCGPCCSVAPNGKTATVCAVSSSAKSVVLQSAQWRGMSFMRSILRAWVTWDSCH